VTGINCHNKVVRGDNKYEHCMKEIPTRDPSLLSAAILTAKQNRLVFPYFDNLNVTFVVLNQLSCCYSISQTRICNK